MPIISQIKDFSDAHVKIRRDFHEFPELGMQEVRTSRIVNKLLEKWGLETFTGIGKTGVVVPAANVFVTGAQPAA